MKLCRFHKSLGLMVMTTILIVACSGDDGIEGGGLTLSGTAATGAAIAQRQIAAKSLDGNTVNVTTALDGKYSLEINSTGPVLLKISTATGDVLYSIADTSGTVNIHPFTDLIVRNWFKVQGVNIESEFMNGKAFSQLPSASEILAIERVIKDLVVNALDQFFLPADIGIISNDFDTNGLGFDGFLDYNQVFIVNNNINIRTTDPKTSIENKIITNITLDTDLTLQDNELPSVPLNLRALAVNAAEITVIWEAATDNIGVSGYHIYRNGNATPIATTPYPIYSDTNIVFETEYCYEVAAIDGAGNVSASKAVLTQPCPITNGVVDNTPPVAPVSLQATAQTDGSIVLTWSQPVFGNVNGFHVYRGPSNIIDEVNNIASVTSRFYTNYNLDSATEYCFKVSAYGVSSVESIFSAQACATTP